MNTKKLNSSSTTKHKTDMNITKINKYKKLNSTSTTEQKNRTQLHFGEPSNKHTQIQPRNPKKK